MTTSGGPPPPATGAGSGGTETALQLSRRQLQIGLALLLAVLIAVGVGVAVIDHRRSASGSAAAPFQAAGMSCAAEHDTAPEIWGCYSGDPWLISMRWQEKDGVPGAFELNTYGDKFVSQLGPAIVGAQNTAEISSVAAAVAKDTYSLAGRQLSLDWGQVFIKRTGDGQVLISGGAKGFMESWVPGSRLGTDAPYRVEVALSQAGRSCQVNPGPYSLFCSGSSGVCTASISEQLAAEVSCEWGIADQLDKEIRATMTKIFAESNTPDTAAVAKIIAAAKPEPEMHATAVDGWLVIVDDRHLMVTSTDWRFHTMS